MKSLNCTCLAATVPTVLGYRCVLHTPSSSVHMGEATGVCIVSGEMNAGIELPR